MKEEDYSKAIEVFSGSPWEAEIIKGLLESNDIRCVIRDSPKIIKFKATNSLRVSCLFCIFKHSPPKTV